MVVIIMNEAKVKPFRVICYCEKRDPAFETQIYNVLIVYKQISICFDDAGKLIPYEGEEPEAHAVSYDEKPGIQAIVTSSPALPAREEMVPLTGIMSMSAMLRCRCYWS